MSKHYLCDPLSDQRVIEFAAALRREHGFRDCDVPDVMSVLGRYTIQTRFGPKSFSYAIVDDVELGDDEAVTRIGPKSVEVVLACSTHMRAVFGDGRARMTIAHELAHAVLHKNVVPLARARVETKGTFVRPFEDVEHQAKVFASHYLMSEAAVASADSPEALAERYFVSLQAARIRWDKSKERDKRASVQAQLLALGEELRASGRQRPSPHGAVSLCTTCGQPTLRDAGNKSYCSNCQRMGDAHADGDGLA